MLRRLLVGLLGLLVAADTEPVQLTAKNFDRLVLNSGKSAFVKFHAPWCAVCKELKPEWDAINASRPNMVLVGDVDCSARNAMQLCQRFGIWSDKFAEKGTGYPTIRYFNPPDKVGTLYNGERTRAALEALVNSLGLTCTADALESCTKQQQAALQQYLDLPPDERAAALAAAEAKLSAAQASHDELMQSLKASFKALKASNDEQGARMKSLRSQFKEAENQLDSVKQELMPEIRMLIAATKREADVKDEL